MISLLAHNSKNPLPKSPTLLQALNMPWKSMSRFRCHHLQSRRPNQSLHRQQRYLLGLGMVGRLVLGPGLQRLAMLPRRKSPFLVAHLQQLSPVAPGGLAHLRAVLVLTTDR